MSMKIKDIITEGIIPHDFVKEASDDFDIHNNFEAHHFSEKNKDYYRENFRDFYKTGQVPIFEKPQKSNDENFTTAPSGDSIESPGARGLSIIRNRTKR